MFNLIGHRFKKIRFLLLVIVTFTLMFYYSFLNEEYELNAHLEEEELPLVIKPTHQDPQRQKPSQIAPKKGFQQGMSDHHPEERLSDPDVLRSKNQYFPLYGKEETQGRKKGELPTDYFEGQKSFNLREWKKKERYPIGKENYFKIPKLSKPSDYPTIQAQVFSDDGQPDKEKLERIKKAFNKSWKIYKDNAYGHDEVTPITRYPSDPFNGWAATLIDTLDTLVLMKENDEFNEAVDFLEKKINFKQSLREDIPVFENVIRILGGLISAYDLSSKKILLSSAVDLAGLIMEAFDTPNRLPLLYYQWRNPIQNRFASNDAYLAEVGSLSLEFSRLSQITGDMKYYDAITRIIETFERSRENFYLKGLLTNDLDLSGCTVLNKIEIDQGLHLNNPNVIKSIYNGRYIFCLKNDQVKSKDSTKQYYSMGGLADSFYEYLPKMYHLLRGEIKSSTVYKKFYLDALERMKEFMIFKPKIPQVDTNIRYISSIAVSNRTDGILEITQDQDMQHLTCFAGGMIAFGSKLFSRPDDIKLAEQVTLGCYDLYKRFGVMPERVIVDKSEYDEDVYDESKRIKYLEDLKKVSDSSGNNLRGSKTANSEVEGIIPTRHRAIDKRDEFSDPIEEELKAKLAQGSDNKEILPNIDIPNYSKDQKEEKESQLKIKKPLIRTKKPTFVPNQTLNTKTEHKVTNKPIWINEMNPTYILRPEAIESVFYMYRITGDSQWRAKGWEMWLSIEKNCMTVDGKFSSIQDITAGLDDKNRVMDSMESFWFAETLKYFYLLFDSTDSWSLDEIVLNTEAHAFNLVDHS